MVKRAEGSNGMNTAAEALGSALGHLAARVKSLKQQRMAITADIQKLLDSAQGLLADLGPHDLLPGGRRKGGRPKGYRMSESTKAKLRAAWKRRRASVQNSD